jgi:hypothetical protein
MAKNCPFMTEMQAAKFLRKKQILLKMTITIKSVCQLLALAAILCMAGCSGCNEPIFVIPDTYESPKFEVNTKDEEAIRNQVEGLTAAVKAGRTNGVEINYFSLTTFFNSGNPSLQSVTTPYYTSRLDGAGNWLDQLSKASGGTWQPGMTTGEGGTYGGYLFDENGLEIEQLIEKGLFGAAMYNHADTLMDGFITDKVIDQVLSSYGAHPDFPNTPTASKTPHPDKFMANYAARRDKNDGNGLYTQMKLAFLRLKGSTLATTDEFQLEQRIAIEDIRFLWEKINAANVIFYCHSMISTMSATNPTDSDKAKALHAYGECIGFLHGWRTIPDTAKFITDDEIDNLLILLNAPYNAPPTTYRLVTEPANELPKLIQVIDLLQDKYNFTDQEVEDFKKNWVAEQGR